MTDETHRFFQIKDQTSYESLCAYVDSTRGYPDGNGTERGLPLWDGLFIDPETTTDKLYLTHSPPPRCWNVAVVP